MRLGKLGTKSSTLKRLHIAAKSGYRDGPASPAVQVSANTQAQCGFRLRAHSHLGFTHMSGACTKELQQLSSPLRFSKDLPLTAASFEQGSLTSQHEWWPSEHQGSDWPLSPSLLNKTPLPQGTHKPQICMGMGSMTSGEVIRATTETPHINWNWTYLSWYSALQVNMYVKLRENRISILFQISLRVPEFQDCN